MIQEPQKWELINFDQFEGLTIAILCHFGFQTNQIDKPNRLISILGCILDLYVTFSVILRHQVFLSGKISPKYGQNVNKMSPNYGQNIAKIDNL